ncbi:hypothetical protein AB0J80_25110 [Actinoplanes sp. NPDC049548]
MTDGSIAGSEATLPRSVCLIWVPEAICWTGRTLVGELVKPTARKV